MRPDTVLMLVAAVLAHPPTPTGTDSGRTELIYPTDAVPGDTASNPGDYTPPCPTGDPVIDAQEVRQGIEALWQFSNPGRLQSERREQIGLIVRHGTRYAIELPPVVAQTPCSAELGALVLPPGTVGLIHTHPYRAGEALMECDPGVPVTRYRGRLSRADQLAARFFSAAYFVDAEHIVRYSRSRILDRWTRC